MLEILVSIATLALFFYAIKLAFKITWGVAKIIAVILLIISASKILSSLTLNSPKFSKFIIAGDGLIGLLCALFILFG